MYCEKLESRKTLLFLGSINSFVVLIKKFEEEKNCEWKQRVTIQVLCNGQSYPQKRISD